MSTKDRNDSRRNVSSDEEMKLRLEESIMDILKRRQHGATMCPSEAPRAIIPDKESWRDYMEMTRDVARSLAERRIIEITQKGIVQDPSSTLRGPIRLRLCQPIE